MIKKMNPLHWLTRAMDAMDAWTGRMDYQGRHWGVAAA